MLAAVSPTPVDGRFLAEPAMRAGKASARATETPFDALMTSSLREAQPITRRDEGRAAGSRAGATPTSPAADAQHDAQKPAADAQQLPSDEASGDHLANAAARPVDGIENPFTDDSSEVGDGTAAAVEVGEVHPEPLPKDAGARLGETRLQSNAAAVRVPAVPSGGESSQRPESHSGDAPRPTEEPDVQVKHRGRAARAETRSEPEPQQMQNRPTHRTPPDRSVLPVPEQPERERGERIAPADRNDSQLRMLRGMIERGRDLAPAVARAEQVDNAIRLENATQPPARAEAQPIAPAPSTTIDAAPRLAPVLEALTNGQQINAQGSAAAQADLARLEESPMTSRIVRGLSAMVNQRGGSMTMRLDPPELGSLRIQMTVSSGTVTAQITAATPQAQGLLENSLATLRAALESHGLAVERLTVQLNQSGQQNAMQNDGSGRSQQDAHDAGDGQSKGRQEAGRDNDGSEGARDVRREEFGGVMERLAGGLFTTEDTESTA